MDVDGGAREILMVLSQKFRGWKKGKGILMGRKGNIDGAVQKILRVEQREKNNGGENKYCWGAKEILFPFSVEQREH